MRRLLFTRSLSVFAFCLLPFSCCLLNAQSPFDEPLTVTWQRQTILEMMLDLEKKQGIQFFYDPYKLPYYRLDYQFQDKSVIEILTKILPPAALAFARTGETGIVVMPKTDLNRKVIDELLARWKNGEIRLPDEFLPVEMSLNFGSPTGKSTVKTARFSGKLFDEETREPVVGATVRVDSSTAGAASNGLGEFEIEVPRGQISLKITALGYRETLLKIALFESGEAVIPLKIRPLGIQEVVIEGVAGANKTTSVSAGLEYLPTALIKELPQFMGEADVVKSLLLLPGVTTVGEGATGFNVRGGNIDQNLVLLDDQPVLNSSHVLGFFSVFNTDLVRSTNLWKGHIPAWFGGRVSSVLDVKMRDGNFQKSAGGLGIGLATAKAWLETPLKKDRLALTAGFRTSYSDWMLRQARVPETRHSSTRFYDANVKLAWRLGGSNSLIINGYRAFDAFRYTRKYGFKYGSQLASASWKTVLGKRLVSSLTAQAGEYSSHYFVPEGAAAFDLANGLNYGQLKWNFTLAARRGHELVFGASGQLNSMKNERFEPLNGNAAPAVSIPKDRGLEWAAWLNDEFSVGKKWTISAGLRAVFYQNFGGRFLAIYADGKPILPLNQVDSIFYKKGEVVKNYGGLEPRFSLNHRLDDANSLKISYNRLKQYVHLISNSAAATPADSWQVSNLFIPPQRADNFGVGWFHDFYQKKWTASFELFFKKTHDVPTYKNFATLLKNPQIETALLIGEMRSYGSELFVKKAEGRWTGWLSYTFSRSEQRANAPILSEEINGGAWFPADFDQPHQANFYLKWAENPENAVSFNFTYRTGRPVSVPENNFQQGSITIPGFYLRNNRRIPDYFRTDVSWTVDRGKSKIQGVKTAVTFSIYNLLARKNAFSVFFQPDDDYGLLKAYKLSIIGAAIPALTLNFSWD